MLRTSTHLTTEKRMKIPQWSLRDQFVATALIAVGLWLIVTARHGVISDGLAWKWDVLSGIGGAIAGVGIYTPFRIQILGVIQGFALGLVIQTWLALMFK